MRQYTDVSDIQCLKCNNNIDLDKHVKYEDGEEKNIVCANCGHENNVYINRPIEIEVN